MRLKRYRGIPYHLWNAYTPMDRFLQFFKFGPTIITHAEGNYVYNTYGKKYFNANSTVWNVAFGYGREELIEAAARQMRELPFASCWGQAHPRAIELAARLVEITGGHYSRVYLGSNGSEAVETALKIARQYHHQSPDLADRGRFKVISLKGSYHGYCFGALTLSGSETYAEAFGPLMPGFVQIPPPYCYRCPFGMEGYPGCGLECAQALDKMIQAEGPETVAAFIMEPVMGDFGVVGPPPEYYRVVGEICRRYSVLFIADEVTTGFGRTGTLFASQDWDPQPDMICLGKAISGGYLPLAATLATEAIFERFWGEKSYFMHGSTQSGNPVCAAVGLEAIKIIIDEKLPENAARMGALFKENLEALMPAHPIIGDVRVHGLMIALELVKDRQTKEPLPANDVFYYMMDIINRGMLVSLSNLRFLPPLNIDEATVHEMVAVVDKALRTGLIPGIESKLRLATEFVRSQW